MPRDTEKTAFEQGLQSHIYVREIPRWGLTCQLSKPWSYGIALQNLGELASFFFLRRNWKILHRRSQWIKRVDLLHKEYPTWGPAFAFHRSNRRKSKVQGIKPRPDLRILMICFTWGSFPKKPTKTKKKRGK